jgi:hypothetical protein
MRTLLRAAEIAQTICAEVGKTICAEVGSRATLKSIFHDFADTGCTGDV